MVVYYAISHKHSIFFKKAFYYLVMETLGNETPSIIEVEYSLELK